MKISSKTPSTVQRITVNLAPADIRKAGPSFGLPIALGILVASGQLSGENAEGAIFVGELSLDGTVRPVTGALPIAIGARDRGIKRLCVPTANAREAARVSDLDVFPVATLSDVVRGLELPETLTPQPRDTSLLDGDGSNYLHDFADVKGTVSVSFVVSVSASRMVSCEVWGDYSASAFRDTMWLALEKQYTGQ